MAERTLQIKLNYISDQLCTVMDLNEAIHMASTDSTVSDSAENAIKAICCVIEAKINSIKEQLEEIAEDTKQ